MSLGGWKDGLRVEIIWVLVKIDNGIIRDFKIGVKMMKWRWEFGDENRKKLKWDTEGKWWSDNDLSD